MFKKIKEIFEFKEMIKSFTIRDLKTRYKGSFLGFLWTFINPLLQLLVYSMMFPLILKISEKNYAMFLFVAIIPWGFFGTSIQGACGIIIGNSNLVTKVYFPREILPITYILSALCNTIFSYSIVFPMLLLFKIPITINILWLPIILIVQAIFNLGLAFIVSSVNVFFRDLEYLISVGIIALYFMTPVMYNIRILPLKYQHLLLLLNPMAGFITMYRDVTYYGTMPKIKLLLYLFTISILIFIIGYVTFQKLQKKFAEIL
jgi:lipopolysaccharide transport system permease protein